MRPRSGRRRSATFPAGQAAVPARAYWGSSLERAQLPDTVTTIGASAFHGCTRLTSVSIPASVTSIGESAFACCTELTSVVLPDSVTTLGAGAFAGCSSLASVKLPRGLLVVNARAFACCTSLTSISLPETITTIGEGAFSACSSLTSAALPNSTRSLGTRAFARCSSLERVEMPAAIASIGASAFLGCSSLAHVRLPISVVTLGERAFDQCSSLAHVEVPVGARVGPNAFRGCLGHLQDGAAENMGETLPRAGWWPPSPRIARAPPSTPKLSSRRSQPECEVYVRGTYPSRHCGGAGSRPWHLSYRKRKLRFLGGTRTTYREVEIEGYERGSIVAAMVKSWKRYELELELVNLGADGALRRLRLRCVSRDLFRVLLKLLSPLLAEPPGRAQARL